MEVLLAFGLTPTEWWGLSYWERRYLMQGYAAYKERNQSSEESMMQQAQNPQGQGMPTGPPGQI